MSGFLPRAILSDLQHARLVTSQRGRDGGGYRLAMPASEISIARVMRVEQGFLADVHGERPEIWSTGAAAELVSVWVTAREAYRQVLEKVSLAGVVSGKLPAHAADLVDMEGAWRSFGDARTS